MSEIDNTAKVYGRKTMAIPDIDCLMPTYGRPEPLLAECVESFLRQDFEGTARLIILNDYAGQILEIDKDTPVPDNRIIEIINLGVRYPTLGLKFRALHDLSTAPLRAVWEDDDIFLPHRLSYSMKYADAAGCFHTPTAWFEHGGAGVLVPADNLHHSSLLISAAMYANVGGYVSEDTAGLDQILFRKLRAAGLVSVKVPVREAYYIYRWQYSGSWHGSGLNGNVSEESAARVRESAQNKTITTGIVTIKPRWERNWAELARKAAEIEAHKEK